MTLRIGIDIGGTFTDFALTDDATGKVAIHKQLTTPADPAEAVIDGVSRLLAREALPIAAVSAVVHGSTLVTNAVIERRGAVTGMLVTEGFRDVLDIAMERRYDLYDLGITFPSPLVPRALRAEVAERVAWDGEVLQPLDAEAVRRAMRGLLATTKLEAVAVCFLHAFTNRAHEDAAIALIRAEFPDLAVCGSADVVPTMREYERWTTATINAYAQPMVDRYLGRIEQGLAALGFRGHLHIMTSSGGTVTPATARRYPVRLLESGPAAGVLMSAHLGRRRGDRHLLAFDMGGTTAKGAIIRNGQPERRYEIEVARVHEFRGGSGLPVRIPVLDMIEIGAGGGSLAGADDRQLLRVGPRSAGADPGPACYGRGGRRPTLTDANLVLGYLDPGFFLGGDMRLDRDAAAVAIEEGVAKPLGLDLTRAAWGIHEIINEDVARAFRVHASEIGFDYRQCSMVGFGGSGPAHALRIARKLRIPRAILPLGAGVMSAFGMLVSPLSFQIARSRHAFVEDLSPESFAAAFAPLEDEARALLTAAGVAPDQIRIERRLDMRYQGQGHEIEVALPDAAAPGALLADLPRLFAAAYAHIFSLSRLTEPMEIMAWKIDAMGPTPALEVRPGSGAAARRAQKGTRRAWFVEAGGYVDCPVYDRYALRPGDSLTGPALIEENESTCVIGPGDIVTIDAAGSLVAEVAMGEQA